MATFQFKPKTSTAETKATPEAEDGTKSPSIVYEAKRMKQFAKASGLVIRSVDGLFHPKDEEELALLEYYENLDRDYVVKVS